MRQPFLTLALILVLAANTAYADFPRLSSIIAKDGSGSNRTRLVSPWDLDLVLHNVALKGDDPGKRNISVGEVTLNQSLSVNAQVLINTSDITFKEKGYLVIGVSGLGNAWRDMAIILVISAEIK